jgi:hypothetical protein
MREKRNEEGGYDWIMVGNSVIYNSGYKGWMKVKKKMVGEVVKVWGE